LRDHLKATLANNFAPEVQRKEAEKRLAKIARLPDGMADVWLLFCYFDGMRKWGMDGPERTSLNELVAYQQLYNVKLDRWTIETLREIETKMFEVAAKDRN
jgi:hypothetical protein